jgi:Protein of unknown function DUF262
LIIGLPVPQVFLYEEDRNKFLVIDGQQRLMTVYYFMSGRFPRRDKRSELIAVFDEHGQYQTASYMTTPTLKLSISNCQKAARVLWKQIQSLELPDPRRLQDAV